jgi:hypothetical protein
VHLIGFIIRIYHDARSSECQIIAELFQKILNVLDMKFHSSDVEDSHRLGYDARDKRVGVLGAA